MDKPGRNDPCPCGSGKKFKKCCEMKVSKTKISNAQVITGPNKIASLFNRHAISAVAPKPEEKVPPDSTHINM